MSPRLVKREFGRMTGTNQKEIVGFELMKPLPLSFVASAGKLIKDPDPAISNVLRLCVCACTDQSASHAAAAAAAVAAAAIMFAFSAAVSA